MAREIVKKGPNFVLYNDGCIRIDNVRASYPHLDKAWAKEETDRAKFSLTGLADKETHEAVKTACVEIINKLCTERKLGKLGSAHKFIRNGDDEGKEECEGMWVIKASENADRRPACRDRKGNLVDQDKIAEMFYPGCYVNMLIRPWAQDNKHGKKINANLIGVQFARDGERFGEGSVSDDDAWDDLGGDDDLSSDDFEPADDDL